MMQQHRFVIVLNRFQVRQRDTESKVISPRIIEEAHTMDNVSRLYVGQSSLLLHLLKKIKANHENN